MTSALDCSAAPDAGVDIYGASSWTVGRLCQPLERGVVTCQTQFAWREPARTTGWFFRRPAGVLPPRVFRVAGSVLLRRAITWDHPTHGPCLRERLIRPLSKGITLPAEGKTV